MSQPFIGEIRMFAGSFAPVGWALCDGQLLAISENDTLFALIGTTYGGDGQSTFGLPDMRGRIPIHAGQGPGLTPIVLGQVIGSESVTLNVNQIPPHTHILPASSTVGNSKGGPNSSIAAGTVSRVYTSDNTPANLDVMNSGTITNIGGSQPHNNMMPFTCINFIISLFGIFPSQY